MSPEARRSKWLNLAPVIERELRVEARSSFSVWLRILSAASVILAMVLAMERQDQVSRAVLGRMLFNLLNATLLVGILIISPLLTADCISRERREGTLGLLFLTPLTPQEVVWAKVATQMLRGLVLVLAALPVMGLPFALGGVTPQMGIQAATVHFTALLLGLAAGLLASVKNVEWTPALVKAEILSGFAFLALRNFAFHGFNGRWQATLSGLGASLLFFLLTIKYAVKSVRDHSNNETGIQPPAAWVSLFSDSEFWRDVFRWNKGQTLDKNPIAWLQEYSWTARLTKWAWVVMVQILVVAGSLYSRRGNFFISPSFLTWLTLLVAAGMAFTATASFRRERENGALELLLVTPLTPAQLVTGRLWGVFCHFFPVGAILGLYWSFEMMYGNFYGTGLLSAIHAFSTVIFVPVVGLSVSLLRLNFILAWFLTCSVSYALPWLVMGAFGLYRWPGRPLPEATELIWLAAAQVGIGIWIVASLTRKLTDRTFAFGGA